MGSKAIRLHPTELPFSRFQIIWIHGTILEGIRDSCFWLIDVVWRHHKVHIHDDKKMLPVWKVHFSGELAFSKFSKSSFWGKYFIKKLPSWEFCAGNHILFIFVLISQDMTFFFVQLVELNNVSRNHASLSWHFLCPGYEDILFRNYILIWV